MPYAIPMSDFDGLRAFNSCMAEQLDLCLKLEELADTLPSKVDTRVALMLTNQLLSTLRRCHLMEEKFIFPVLIDAGTDVGSVIGRLRHEHVEDEDHANDVRDAIQAFTKSQNSGDAERLGYMLRCMFISLRRHLAFDSDYVLPLFRRTAGL